MIFRQFVDFDSKTYTYLIASTRDHKAILIDPVKDHASDYLRLLRELGLLLVAAVDTHVHADHITALGYLMSVTGCATLMGEQSKAVRLSARFGDGQELSFGRLSLRALHTPGHTDDSYCLFMQDRVFTGDTLLIRSTGRTDFQNGSARAAYESITRKLFMLPPETLVYPGHDYNGHTVSTIAEEIRYNPRLQVASIDEYEAMMGGLQLPPPRNMHVAVPANLRLGEVGS